MTDTSIEEEFLKKTIEVQAKIHRIASQKEFENQFVSTEKKSFQSNLKATKKMLKTYYLQQFSIKKKFSKQDDQTDQPVTKKHGLFSFFSKKDGNESDVYKFNFELIKCQTISRFEEDIFSFDNFTTFTSIEKNQDFLDLIAFSVLPSLYNFFLTKNDINDFVNFLKKVFQSSDDPIYFQTYSSIIYYTPFFLNFCHNIIFKEIIIECLHNPTKIKDYSNKKVFYDTIIRSIKSNQHLCPPLLKTFIDEFSSIKNFSLSDHIKNNFFLPLFQNPIQFSVVREFDFLPDDFFAQIEKDEDQKENDNENGNANDNANENQGNDENIEEEEKDDVKKLDKKNTDYFGRFIKKILKIKVNDRLLITEKKVKCERIFTSFDIDIIKRPSEMNKLNFSDYCFYFYCPKYEESDLNESTMFSIEKIKIFKEMLKLADPLPQKMRPPKNRDELFSILEKYLVDNGDFNTQFERRLCFENFKKFVQQDEENISIILKKISEKKFTNIKSLDRNKEKLDKIIQKKQSWNIISSLIHPQLLHIDNSLNMINSMAYNDISIIPYANEDIEKIVKSPQIIIDDFEKYQASKDSNTELFYYYYRKLSNLRFSDFLEVNENVLDKYDGLVSSFIECNHEIITSDILSQESGHYISNMVKYNAFLFDTFIEEFKAIFEQNGSLFEKQRNLFSLFNKCNLFLGQRGTDPLLLFVQILFIKSNPNQFLSNFAFLENFYFKIIPDNNNDKLREMFYTTFNYVFPMKRKKLFSSIVPFIAKNINAMCYSSENVFNFQSERLLFASKQSFKTYLVIINYTNTLPKSIKAEILIMKGDNAISTAKNKKIPIKIAICKDKDIMNNLKEKFNIHIVEESQSLKKELKKCILNEYEKNILSY